MSATTRLVQHTALAVRRHHRLLRAMVPLKACTPGIWISPWVPWDLPSNMGLGFRRPSHHGATRALQRCHQGTTALQPGTVCLHANDGHLQFVPCYTSQWPRRSGCGTCHHGRAPCPKKGPQPLVDCVASSFVRSVAQTRGPLTQTRAPSIATIRRLTRAGAGAQGLCAGALLLEGARHLLLAPLRGSRRIIFVVAVVAEQQRCRATPPLSRSVRPRSAV